MKKKGKKVFLIQKKNQKCLSGDVSTVTGLLQAIEALRKQVCVADVSESWSLRHPVVW